MFIALRVMVLQPYNLYMLDLTAQLCNLEGSFMGIPPNTPGIDATDQSTCAYDHSPQMHI